MLNVTILQAFVHVFIFMSRVLILIVNFFAYHLDRQMDKQIKNSYVLAFSYLITQLHLKQHKDNFPGSLTNNLQHPCGSSRVQTYSTPPSCWWKKSVCSNVPSMRSYILTVWDMAIPIEKRRASSMRYTSISVSRHVLTKWVYVYTRWFQGSNGRSKYTHYLLT